MLVCWSAAGAEYLPGWPGEFSAGQPAWSPLEQVLSARSGIMIITIIMADRPL